MSSQAAEVLRAIRDSGGDLRLRERRLLFVGPERLSTELKEAVQEHRAELLTKLSAERRAAEVLRGVFARLNALPYAWQGAQARLRAAHPELADGIDTWWGIVRRESHRFATGATPDPGALETAAAGFESAWRAAVDRLREEQAMSEAGACAACGRAMAVMVALEGGWWLCSPCYREPFATVPRAGSARAR